MKIKLQALILLTFSCGMNFCNFIGFAIRGSASAIPALVMVVILGYVAFNYYNKLRDAK